MKNKELKLEETEASHTVGGSGEGRDQVRGKWRGCKCYSAVRYTIFNRSRRIRHKREVSFSFHLNNRCFHMFVLIETARVF